MQQAQPMQIRQIPSQPIQQNQNYSNQYYNNNQNNFQVRKSASVQAIPASSMPSYGMIPMQTSQSMQSMESSEPGLSQQSSQNFIQSQTFPVFYDNVKFMVNPISLCQASRKFQQLIQPFLNNNNQQQFSELHLEVLGNDFTTRNMNNFLRLCQNLTTDVQDSEMEEICQIAKLFQADQIYNTGVAFVRRQIDPNFNIPDSKYDGSDGNTYLILDGETNVIHHADLSDLDFENSYSETNSKLSSISQNQIPNQKSTYPQSNNMNQNVVNSIPNQTTSSTNQNENENYDNQNNQLSHQNDENVQNDQQTNSPMTIPNPTGNDENRPDNSENATDDSNKASQSNPTISHKSVIYVVRVEGHFFKCPIFRFCANGHVMFTAKQKDCDIYIGEGNEVHINKMRDKHVAHIFQCDSDHNLIRLKDFQFRLQYVNSGKPGHISIDVGFPLGDKDIRWTPKTPRYDMETNRYYLNYSGQYHHEPIKSRRNIVLQNLKGNPTFIVRKVRPHVYEIECLPAVDPLIAFTIGLSDIVGPSPYYDYFG